MPTRAILRHTPLFAIEAIAVDTETTGWDPGSARLLEVGAVVIRGGVLREETAFQRLAASPEPIPAAATAVHGIENSDLAGAPTFSEVYAELVASSGSARDIAGIIARELGAAVNRATKLAEQQIADEGLGESPCPYSVLILGSAGRGESLLALDQDHAIIFAGGQPDGMEDRWFGKLGMRIAEILHTIGVPYCPGGVMAGNPAFRGSLDTWRRRIARWIDRAAPEDLLNVDIFFDFRPVCGDGILAAQLWNEAWEAARASPPFLLLLTEAGQGHRAPIGFLGRLKTEEGRIDLKRYGLWPIVRCARLLALRHGVRCHSTTERLDGIRALGISGTDLAAAGEAHERFLELILKAQLAELAAGERVSNRVPLKLVGAENGASRLRADLRLAASLYEVTRDHLVAIPR